MIFLTSLAVLFCGYSLFAALNLIATHFDAEHYADQAHARAMGAFLVFVLGALQLAHFAWLSLDLDWVASVPYGVALYLVAPTFFLYSRPLLSSAPAPLDLRVVGHALPAALCPLLPRDLALPLAFSVGAGYLLWLGRTLYALRRERSNFQHEMLLLGAVFLIAVGVSALGLFQAVLPGKLFFVLYAIAIGLAFLIVNFVLGRRPTLSVEVSESAKSYAVTTLANVDAEAALGQLQHLLHEQRLYADAELSLPGLAKRLGLTTHQLSELMNTRLGKGFSRYLREQRVAAAKQTLCDEPAASVLSVGLSVGFSAQSNFYEAFREIEGMTPGQYRKLHLAASLKK